MIEVVMELRVERAEGFYYFLEDDGVRRVVAVDDEDGVPQPKEGEESELVHPSTWTFESGYLYQLNDDGNLVRFRLLPELKWGPNRTLPPIANETVAPGFISTPRKLWMMVMPDDVHVDVVAIADDRDTWSVPDAPELRKGDGVLLWAGAPHHCIAGFAEVNSEVVRDEEGVGSFEIRMLTHTFMRPLYRDDLAYDSVLGAMECFTAEEADPVVELDDRSAARLLRYIGETNPAVRSITAAWGEALRTRSSVDDDVSLEDLMAKDPAKSPPQVETTELVSGEEYRVLSVQPPWAWSIIFAGKDIENRSWTTPHRGKILVHASSKKFTGKALEEARRQIAECCGIDVSQVPKEFPQSQIIGTVDVADCIRTSRSRWAFRGEEHWVLENPRKLAAPVKNVDGKLNLWKWTAP